ncbi:DNA primase [Albibacterium sp.]|uniref:DNA primase n=1 Tax=Albibacterium sp. TaxID=2952885 RepID=UPI002CCC4324|nr:DNA primase [Albibacterium sp.]HUH19999.1 DNA primase [Albibacterium sp.]
MIKQSTIDRVFDTIQIEEVVGDFVDLKKRGTNLLGLCPFHNEKTPSFNVSISKGIYKCFGCGEGGHAVDFVMKHEKYSYPEAIRYLAKKYNIEVEEDELSEEQQIVNDQRESLFIVTNWAAEIFQNSLWNSNEGKAIGLSYFKERGYREDIIKKFELGYSPESWDYLYAKAVQAGHQEEYLEKTGLIIKKEGGKTYDRFRSRVMFPIHNLTGRTLGFGGRTLKTDKKVPKYVNSPESDIYHKSAVLYGLYFAKKSIVTVDNCYLVEGYADVISMHQAGVENVVASSGTSLTTEQIKLIARFTKNVTMLYDGDAAGIKASLRGTDMLLKEGLNVKVLLFSDGHDPDSYIQKFGPNSFQEYVQKNQQDFISFKTQILLQDAGSDPIKRAEVIREVVESIALIPDQIKASVFIRDCSVKLDIEERILISELNKMRLQQSRKHNPPRNEPSSDLPPDNLFDDGLQEAGNQLPEINSNDLQEQEIIRLLLHYGEMPASWLEEKSYPIAILILSSLQDVEFTDPAAKKVADIYIDYLNRQELPEQKIFITNADKEVSNLVISLLSSPYNLSPNWNDDKRQIYVKQEVDNLKETVLKAIFRMKKRKIDERIQKVRDEMKEETNPENIAILSHKYLKLKEVEKDTLTFLGTVISK